MEARSHPRMPFRDDLNYLRDQNQVWTCFIFYIPMSVINLMLIDIYLYLFTEVYSGDTKFFLLWTHFVFTFMVLKSVQVTFWAKQGQTLLLQVLPTRLAERMSKYKERNRTTSFLPFAGQPFLIFWILLNLEIGASQRGEQQGCVKGLICNGLSKRNS